MLFSCTDQSSDQALNIALDQLENQKNENENLLAQIRKKSNHKGNLVHYVFLDIKNDVSENQYNFLIEEIKNLAKIPGVKDFEVGRYESMEDERALKNREVNFEMRFENKMEYYGYQKNKDHIKVRELLAPFLAKPPLTYDYIVQ